MVKHILSKSTFMYGCQCQKRLYLHKFKPLLKNPPDERQEFILNRGTSIGQLAQNLFPGGIDASPPDSYSYEIAANLTNTLIAQGEGIIYEATFQYDSIMCAVDILVRNGDSWYAFEVKSTTSVKQAHVQDAALQYHVLINSGIPLADISVVHLNNSYTKNGELNISALFTLQSVLEEVRELQPMIRKQIQSLREMLSKQVEPVADIGYHCSDPYECNFTNHCWSHIPKINSVFELSRGAGYKLYKEGFRHLDEIPLDFPLATGAAMQLAHYQSGEIHIDSEALKKFLEPLTYPLYFFDFETTTSAIPEFDNTRPYQQIPFQFSLHIKQNAEAPLEHYSFLGDGITDSRPLLLRMMLLHLGASGPILCYNMSFEKGRLKELARSFPLFAPELDNIQNRIVDLMIPFQRRWYYHPAFKGNHSIKDVLPVLAPHLSYDTLNVSDGGTASMIYGQLKFQDPDVRQQQRQDLLDYCKLDTLALVEVLESLKGAISVS